MRPRTIANVTVGRPQTRPSRPSHIRGIREGNARGSIGREVGIIPVGADMARGTAHRSTGINPARRNPIDPRSPNLSPA